MKEFRITFSGNNKCKSVDIKASCSDDAFVKAYEMPEATSRIYTEISIEEVPEGPKVIGIEFEYEDTAFKKTFTDYIFIRANDEAQAVDYYNRHYKGGRFWFHAGKTEDDGKCIRGKVLETYYAAVPGYDADATA